MTDAEIDALIATLAESRRDLPTEVDPADVIDRGLVVIDGVATEVAREDDPRCADAERSLVELICRADYVERVRSRIEATLAARSDPDPTSERKAGRGATSPNLATLWQLLDETRPAMVAEVWSRGQQVNTQRLLVGVPQVHDFAGIDPANPDAPPRNVTHFDRIDDHMAHCVRGVTLYEGDWPVGVAIPHPKGEPLTFVLVNLPTGAGGWLTKCSRGALSKRGCGR